MPSEPPTARTTSGYARSSAATTPATCSTSTTTSNPDGCRSRPRGVRPGAADRGREGGPLLRGRGLVADQRTEHLAGVLEDDPGEQLDDLRHRELLEQNLELAVGDLRVVHRDSVREGDRERVPPARLLGRRPAQGRA